MANVTSLIIREAKGKDLKTITEIYNHAILHTNVTFETDPRTLQSQDQWLSNRSRKHPVLVAEIDNAVVGWVSLNPWSSFKPYQNTAEISVYLQEDFKGRGIGKALVDEIIKKGKEADLHTIIARITEGNEVSINIHKSFGFKEIGVMKEVGVKFGKLLDVHLYQLILSNHDSVTCNL
jgi:L-amino acid N-acyltransferase